MRTKYIIMLWFTQIFFILNPNLKGVLNLKGALVFKRQLYDYAYIFQNILYLTLTNKN